MADDDDKKDVFKDLNALRLAPGDGGGAGIQELLTHVPLERPRRQEFFRTHRDPDWSLTTSILFDDENFGRDAYLVMPQMRGALLGDARPVLLTPIITRQGVFKFWPLKLPLDDGRPNAWFESAREALELSKERWVCMKPDMALGAYRVLQAIGDIPDPVWPNKPINELLEIAFRGRIIDSADHPFVRRLRCAT
jgi:hypothetical protein